MIEASLGRHARARLWTDGELPPLTGWAAVRRRLPADPRAAGEHRSLAVEVVIPRGGMISYGLLGATYEPVAGDSLDVAVLPGDWLPFERALAGPPEEVVTGLTTDYAEAVMDGAVAAAGTVTAVPGGSLIFDRAAHGAIGSSVALFRQLAAGITRMTLGGTESWQDTLREELRLRSAG